MGNDYSQYGEGKHIANYFKGSLGTLLSIGENDGKTLSNVLGLIELGWAAHLVEPSKTAFDKMKDLHKDNKLVQCYNFAITETDGLFDYYESNTHLNNGDTALLSTLVKSEIKRWKGTQQFEEKKVSGLSFNSFIKASQIEQLDLISIDAEGMDYSILKQIDPVKLGVKMLIVETNSENDQQYLSYMVDYGYKIHYRNFCNTIFIK